MRNMDKIQILTELIEKASENLNRQRPDSEWKKEFEFLLKKVQLQDRLFNGIMQADEAIRNETNRISFYYHEPNSFSIYADPLKTVSPFKDKNNDGK